MPTLVTGQLQGKSAVYAATGDSHTLCTTADGSVFTWGEGGYGLLGLGDESDRLVPSLVRGELQNRAVLQVAAGDHHSTCVTGDGSVYSWGANDEAQLGVVNLTGAANVPLLSSTPM